jgi:hypothetical protein
MKKILLVAVFLLPISLTCRAWIYPEHRDITLAAIVKLDTSRRALLDRLWSEARKGYESRLSEMVADPLQGIRPTHLDFAAWPAIGGDHSTSPENLMHNVLHTEWILKVADIGAQLKINIATARYESERINRLRDSDIQLLRADPEYVSRAGSNNGHFMLAIPNVNISAAAYFDSCFTTGTPLNTVGTYTWFHNSALLKAKRLASENLTPLQRSALALSAMADEAFAIHFLEDSFASGHVAGVWGDASQRKGTHDYYNAAGLQVTTWNGERIILMGDAYIRPHDIERAAYTIRLSLEQLIDAAYEVNGEKPLISETVEALPDTFNVSKAEYMPARMRDPKLVMMCNEVLVTTPVPGLATGLGAMPRFSSELGPFLGITAGVKTSVLSGGFGSNQYNSGVVAGLELGFRVGLGMDGVLNQTGDGLVFLDLGWKLDAASSNKFDNEPILKQFGTYASALPSRDAYYFRFRMPFFLIPGDLLIAGPVMLLAAPDKLNKMIVTSGNGGLIPWQTGIITAIGRFQFVLGREIGVCLYGTGNGPDAFLLPDEETGDQALVTMYTTQLEFPILEYRFLRTYAARQSASLMFQFYGGVDIPGKKSVIEEYNYPAPQVKTIWFAGVRMVFDWRHYFSAKTN